MSAKGGGLFYIKKRLSILGNLFLFYSSLNHDRISLRLINPRLRREVKGDVFFYLTRPLIGDPQLISSHHFWRWSFDFRERKVDIKHKIKDLNPAECGMKNISVILLKDS
jgi:hypothetical protein